MKRPKRPSRMAWFAFDVDAFMDDHRTQGLTNRERATWAFMLIRSFRNRGMVVVDPYIVSEQTGCTKKEAEILLMKLYDTGLLKPTSPEERSFEAFSPRMAAEYEHSKSAYDRFSNMGKASADQNGTTNLRLVK